MNRLFTALTLLLSLSVLVRGSGGVCEVGFVEVFFPHKSRFPSGLS